VAIVEARPIVVAEPPVERPSEPEPEAEAEAEVTAEPDGRPSDDLFARLRAERAAALAQAEVVLAPVPETPASGEQPEPEPPAEPEPAHEASRFERRDGVLEPTERALTRAMKRALADEQNEVLDALRRFRGTPKIDALLPPAADHVTRYADLVVEHLHGAAAAGADALEGETPDVDALGELLGTEISEDLRVRIERALDGLGSDEEALTEAISATYREWKTSRAEPFARHHAAAAYAFGAFSAASVDELIWVVDRAEGGCPDCDDNALAGPTRRGAAYPTGQLHPPAHAGCRCLVLPAT
jgi:hypothetical protein